MQNGDYFNENLRQHEDVPLGEESTRLALVNMDWEHLKALDILALIQSFVSSTGSVTSVIIYLSDFGKKRLELENQMGPTGVYSMSRHADANRNLTAIREHLPGNSSTVADGFGLDIEKVRQYEKDKLKYYFAIISFDSINTASSVYNECDGLEFETSSNVLDLRFVPDDTTFSNRRRDVATTIPNSYKPPEWFATAALQQSNVSLTWDASDDERKGLTRWHANNEEKKRNSSTVREENLRSYLAEISDGEQEINSETQKKREIGNLRHLLGLSSADDGDDSAHDSYTNEKQLNGKRERKQKPIILMGYTEERASDDSNEKEKESKRDHG